MQKLFVIWFFTISMTTISYAADQKGNFSVRGLGGQTCESFATIVQQTQSSQRSQDILLFTSWLNGYLSHANRTTEGVFDVSPIVEGSDLLQLIYNQCVRTPQAYFETTTSIIIEALADAIVVEASPLITLKNEQQQRSYRQSTVIRVQQKLIEQGRLEGKADGVVGPATTTAIQAFQTDEGLSANGFLDYATLVRILLN